MRKLLRVALSLFTILIMAVISCRKKDIVPAQTYCWSCTTGSVGGPFVYKPHTDTLCTITNSVPDSPFRGQYTDMYFVCDKIK